MHPQQWQGLPYGNTAHGVLRPIGQSSNSSMMPIASDGSISSHLHQPQPSSWSRMPMFLPPDHSNSMAMYTPNMSWCAQPQQYMMPADSFSHGQQNMSMNHGNYFLSNSAVGQPTMMGPVSTNLHGYQSFLPQNESEMGTTTSRSSRNTGDTSGDVGSYSFKRTNSEPISTGRKMRAGNSALVPDKNKDMTREKVTLDKEPHSADRDLPRKRFDLRVLTADVQSVKRFSEQKGFVELMFEVFGILDSAVVTQHAVGKKFKIRTGRDSMECMFYEIDRPIAKLIRGQWIRCVGKLDITGSTLHCVSVRLATTEEQNNASPMVEISREAVKVMAMATQIQNEA